MSPIEHLPNIGRIRAIRTAVLHPSIDNPEDVDVFEAERDDLPLDGDIIGAVTHELGRYVDLPNDEVLGRIAEGGERALLEYDSEVVWDAIFESMPRRTARMTTRSPTGSPESNMVLA